MSNVENGIQAEVGSLNSLGCNEGDAGFVGHGSVTDASDIQLNATDENNLNTARSDRIEQEDLLMNNIDDQEPDKPFSTPSDYHDPDWEEEYRHYLKIAATFRKYK